MSTPQKPVARTTPPPAATPAPVAPKVTKSAPPQKEITFLFDKENYAWMAAGIALIFIGFMLMSGGKSANPHEFHYDEIYSFRRITLAPMIILLGFAIEVYAIMKKPKDAEQKTAL